MCFTEHKPGNILWEIPNDDVGLLGHDLLQIRAHRRLVDLIGRHVDVDHHLNAALYHHLLHVLHDLVGDVLAVRQQCIAPPAKVLEELYQCITGEYGRSRTNVINSFEKRGGKRKNVTSIMDIGNVIFSENIDYNKSFEDLKESYMKCIFKQILGENSHK